GISNSAVVDSSGNFTLVNVATGSWTVYISSGGYFTSSGTFGGASHGFSDSMTVALDSASTFGYITGTVTDVSGAPLDGIEVYSSGSPSPIPTNSLGRYTLGLEPNTVVVTANYQLADSQYVEVSSVGVVVETGKVINNVDFTLAEGGNISGWVGTSDVDPLPNTPIIAIKSGVALGDGITNEDGYFYINGISSGTYTIKPQLEAGESSLPPDYTEDVEANEDVFIGSFTVSGAMGYIKGDVTADGEVIDTGVLIYASTSTIASNPPILNSVLRSGSVIYYAASSNFDGTYNLPVRGGYTYNIYAWYTTWSGDTPTTDRDEHEGVDAISVAAGETVERDFS
ncbi:MAG: carboxypeptidase regulatory-like domain-containing protein, partial [Elusimicrobiales bacterium]|nr:carboxypeptidase regulatory-like domain-containing protein [Elusimicrobiales bacterium]